MSSEHAVIHHNGSGWELRDLGSKNGTFVGKKRIPPGMRLALARGVEFAIGGRDLRFVLTDAIPPVASARHVHTGDVRLSSNGLLVLPDDEQPAVTVFERYDDGRWLAEWPDKVHEVVDREVIIVDGAGWRLELPALSAATLDTTRIGPTLETIALRFVVSRDEEHVELFMAHEGNDIRVPSRTYHYLLLTLARARLADRSGPGEDRGWVDRETLCGMLSIDANKLNVDIFRARGQFGSLGVLGAAGLVLRRPDTGKLRLGIDRVRVVPLGSKGAPPADE